MTEQASMPAKSNRDHLLIVDDDRLMRAMLVDIFSPLFAITEAADGREAADILGHVNVSAVLSDHHMPGMTGVEVLATARALQPTAVRILVTASDDIQVIRDAVNIAHVQRVVAKPVHPVEVEGIVVGALRERALEAENERLVVKLRAALDELKAREQELERELAVRTEELRHVLSKLGDKTG